MRGRLTPWVLFQWFSSYFNSIFSENDIGELKAELVSAVKEANLSRSTLLQYIHQNRNHSARKIDTMGIFFFNGEALTFTVFCQEKISANLKQNSYLQLKKQT